MELVVDNDALSLSKGYKQTEVGLIPSDWEVFTFGDVVDYTKGFAFKSKDYRKDGIRIIRVSDTTFDSIKKENGIYVDENAATDYKNWRLDENDLIFTTVGSKPPMYDSMVGKVIMVSKEFEGSFLNQNAVLIRAKKRTKELQAVLLSHFRMKRYLQHIELIYRGNANQASITLKELFEFKIPLPKIEAELTAIATALSDADALISTLEKLIAKKRNIKQGAMQQLLKPKEGWEELSIFQIADFKKELFDDGDWIESEYITDKGIRLIQTGNIGIGTYLEKESKKYINEDSFKKLRCKQLKIGDLLICRLAEPAGRACILPFIGEDKVITSVDVSIYRPNEETVNRQFLNQIFTTNNWFNTISELCGGTTHKRISRGALGRVKIQLPNIQEQTRIATILSDMDTEIQALETKLEKYRKIKLGMMQNLLTGKIRLV